MKHVKTIGRIVAIVFSVLTILALLVFGAFTSNKVLSLETDVMALREELTALKALREELTALKTEIAQIAERGYSPAVPQPSPSLVAPLKEGRTCEPVTNEIHLPSGCSFDFYKCSEECINEELKNLVSGWQAEEVAETLKGRCHCLAFIYSAQGAKFLIVPTFANVSMIKYYVVTSSSEGSEFVTRLRPFSPLPEESTSFCQYELVNKFVTTADIGWSAECMEGWLKLLGCQVHIFTSVEQVRYVLVAPATISDTGTWYWVTSKGLKPLRELEAMLKSGQPPEFSLSVPQPQTQSLITGLTVCEK